MSCYTEELLDQTVNQIVEDVENGDTTAIYELLNFVEAKHLENFLNEEDMIELKNKWKITEGIQ